jgi:hypothetical protein
MAIWLDKLKELRTIGIIVKCTLEGFLTGITEAANAEKQQSVDQEHKEQEQQVK